MCLNQYLQRSHIRIIFEFLKSKFVEDYDHITRRNLNFLRKELMELTNEHNERIDNEYKSDYK